ncbi:MAG: hypothetical protein ACJ0PW_00025 [Flavobacteriaceae bacterium]|tara:strand:+ start:1511 stop:1927 length:417 start_codon:yes stop_codon:yes gene_type:complete
MNKKTLLVLFLSSTLLFSQRGRTGDKTFENRFPEDVSNPISNATLELVNEVDHDIIVVIRDQRKKYVRHVYIRNREKFIFDKLPISRIYVQFKSKEFFFEDFERTTINFGDKHKFNFFFDPSQEENYFRITEEEFFKP